MWYICRMKVYLIVRGNAINHASKLVEPTLFYGKQKKKKNWFQKIILCDSTNIPQGNKIVEVERRVVVAKD